jgi:hypothetical protein
MAALHPFGPCLFHCRSTTGDDFVLACASQTDALHAAVEFVIANCETAFHHAGEGSRLSDLHSLLAAHRWPEAIRFFNDWTDGSISIQPNPPESSLKGVVEPAFPL